MLNQSLLRRVENVKRDNKLNNKKLAELWGVSESTVKGYWREGGEKKIPKVYLEKLADTYNVDKDWLIYGKNAYIYTASQLKGSAPPESLPEKDFKEEISLDLHGSGYVIPFYSLEAMSAPVESFISQTITPSFQMRIPGFEDCDMNFIISDQAMIPSLLPGGMALSKTIKDKDLIIPGEPYFIITMDYRIIRRLKDSKKPGYVIAFADNPNGMYQDIQIPLDKIILLYLIKGQILRTHQ